MQIKNSFDVETIKKIGKGALFSMSSAAAVAGVQYFSQVDFSTVCTESAKWLCNGFIAPFFAFVVPMIANTVKEYRKGEEL